MPTLPQFLPRSWDDRSINQQLDATIQRAQNLYGAVAYWTIGPEVLHHRLVELLRHPESFCCVDLHLPTDVDKLNAFYRQGAHQLYLQCHEVRQQGERHLHRHLLHTKLLVFDLPNERAEIWVGSYNFTKQALLGANREASLVLSVSQGSDLYRQVRAYLEAIRSDAHCHRFDPARLDDYKQLQGLPEDDPEPECFVLPVAWHSDRMPTLTRQTLLLLGHDPDERRVLAQIDGTNAPVILRAYDLATGLVSHYGTTIQNQGAIDRNVPSSYDLTFGQRHLAIRPRKTLPYVAPQEHRLPPAELREFGFWANLLVLDQLPASLQLLPQKRADTAKWQRDWQATQTLREELNPEPDRLAGRQLDFAYDAQLLARDQPREIIPELTADEWLQWAIATSLLYRGKAKLGQVGVFGATFWAGDTRNHETPLMELDHYFTPYSRPYLETSYEQPLRRRYYENTAPNQLPPESAAGGPRLEKLVEKYRLRY